MWPMLVTTFNHIHEVSTTKIVMVSVLVQQKVSFFAVAMLRVYKIVRQ